MEAAAVVDALHRLYSGDAAASQELERFQAWPGAQAVALELLKSMVVEVQFFAASTLCRIAAAGRITAQAAEVDWLLSQACACAHKPAVRQLLAAAAALAGQHGSPLLSARALSLLESEAHWWVAAELLMILPPEPPVAGVCHRLSTWLGRKEDELLFRCALRHPSDILEAPIAAAVERAVREGLLDEVSDAERLPQDFRNRLFAAACQGVQNGHAEAAAGVLRGLPGLRAELVEPAAQLLRAPEAGVRAAGAALWQGLPGRLEEEQRGPAFERFAACFFEAAAWAEGSEEDEMERLREALWGLAQEWQLATPSRLTLAGKALEELERSLGGAGNWQRAEAALWTLSKYAKSRPQDAARAAGTCVLVLRELAPVPGLAPLATSACALLEVAPRLDALPVLLDRRLADPQLRGADVRPAIAAAVCACCAAGAEALWADGSAPALAEELQRRALAGEEGLVAAAAQVLAVRDVRPLAEQWARLCAEATPDTARPRALALLATIVNAEVCLALWRDCASMLQHVPAEARVQFVERAAGFVREAPALLAPVLEVWIAVWSQAEGEEGLVAALCQLVRASARSSAAAAPAVEALIRSLGHGHLWAPQALDAAFGVLEASLAPAGSSWPLTSALAPCYGFALHHAAAITLQRPVLATLPVVAALASWVGEEDSCDGLGRALCGCLQSQEQAVRALLTAAEDRRLACRIASVLWPGR